MIKKSLMALVGDVNTRKVFETLHDNINNAPIIKADFKTLELSVDKAGEHKILHKEKYTPNAVLLVFYTGTGVPTISYDKIDATNIVIDTTGPCKLRLLYGRL